MPKITVRFYYIHPSQHDTFVDLLERVNAVNIADRTRIVNGYHTRLQRMETYKPGQICGDIVKIRMRDAPTNADLNGSISEIPFGDTEGAGEHNAFMFDPESNVLAYQSGGGYRGTGISAFLNYLSIISIENYDFPSRFDATQLIHTSTVEEIQNLDRASRFSYRVATGGCSDLQDIVSGGKDFGEVYTEHVFSVGRQSGSLNLAAVTGFVRQLFKRDGERVLKADVRGQDAEGRPVELHIVDGHSIYTEYIDPPDGQRSIPYELRRRSVWSAWRERKEIIDGK